MTHEKSSLGEIIATLKQQRDELALKIHLGAAELKQEWEENKEKLETLTRKYDPVKHAVDESTQDVIASLALLAEEIKNSFERIRKQL